MGGPIYARSWESALDVQLDLSLWLDSEEGRRFCGTYFGSAYAGLDEAHVDNDGKSTRDLPVAGVSYGRAWAERQSAEVFNAEPVFVEPAMMRVVEAAVGGFKPEPLRATDLITQHGLLILPAPMYLPDIRGKRTSWRVLSWTPAVVKHPHLSMDGSERFDTGIHLTLFHDIHDVDDYDSNYPNRMTTSLFPTQVSFWLFGQNHPGSDDKPGDKGGPMWDIDPTASVATHTQLQAIWRLLIQHLAEPVKMRPPKGYWRRAVRAKMEHRVTVVRLRRPASPPKEGDPEVVHWTHRWLVGGHWRNQWYPSIGQHRQIWISPFVKGPEELPLVPNKARVFTLSR